MRPSPSEEATFRGGDAVVPYVVYGDPRAEGTIVFCNGLFHGHHAWHGIFQDAELRKGWRLLVADYRGCGPEGCLEGADFRLQDVARDLLEVARASGSRIDAVVGHSIGVQVALWMALLEPESVRRLALLSGSVRMEPHSRSLARGACDLLASGADPHKVFAMVYPWFFSGPYLEKLEDLRQEFIGTYVRYNRDVRGLVKFLRAIAAETELPARLSEIDAPVLVVSGGEDRIFPPHCQEEIAGGISASKLVKFPGCGHSALTERSRELRPLLHELLKTPIARVA